MTAAWFALNMMHNGWRDDDERRERTEQNMARDTLHNPSLDCRCDYCRDNVRITPLDPTPYASGGFHNYNFEPELEQEPRSEMKKYKVYLKSGTVVTLLADSVYEFNSRLVFHVGDNRVEEGSFEIIASFADWEGYQYLRPAPQRDQEKSGS